MENNQTKQFQQTISSMKNIDLFLSYKNRNNDELIN